MWWEFIYKKSLPFHTLLPYIVLIVLSDKEEGWWGTGTFHLKVMAMEKRDSRQLSFKSEERIGTHISGMGPSDISATTFPDTSFQPLKINTTKVSFRVWV